MGLYENWVLPRLLDMAMRNHVLDPYRRSAITSTRGLVLEIGVGSGLNLPLYGPEVCPVVGLDPSSELLRLARERAAKALVTGLAGQSFGAEYSVRRCRLRYDRDDLDTMLDPEPG